MSSITWKNQGDLTPVQISAVTAAQRAAVAYINGFLARPIDWDVQLNVDAALGDQTVATASLYVTYGWHGANRNIYLSFGQYQAMTGIERTGFDAVLSLNPDFVDRLYWDPDPRPGGTVPAGRIDGFSVLLHETMHSLVFQGWTGADGVNRGTASTLYDAAIVVKNGSPFLRGPNAAAVHGGDVPLKSGGVFHLAEGLDDLMGAYAVTGQRQALSALDLAILADNGIGTIRDDILSGSVIDDALKGGPGNDRIDGGGGTNSAVYDGAARGYTVSYGTALTVRDKVGSEGTDTLQNIQTLSFADGTLDVTTLAKTAALAKAEIDALVELYIATFNRAPDALGLAYWGSQFKDGMGLEAIARSFFVQPETALKYPATTTATGFVTGVYGNVLGRAADPQGLDYWVAQLSGGTMGRDTFVLAMINGAHGNPEAGGDVAYLANKVAVGEHFALTRGLNDGGWAQRVMAGVDASPASVAIANALTDSFAAQADAPATAQLVVQILGIAA